ncbi:unnamed protein product [Rotaria sp. Silwood1]|nr:unnamed protein product [Rotaria sp. Silwood1]CAF3476854.1 unnamed protein product [Rotaria sp. Silwood1]CAF4827448.1 unnamed protein product [Rotaria sp. Silwood1]
MALQNTTTSASIIPSSIKTWLEPNDIWILSQDRVKVPETNLIPSICFYNGTFLPIHAGHISVLEYAKQYINNLGTHELLAAYISPSHSEAVAKKLSPEELIGVGHRLSMIYFAIENLDWVMVDLFQIFQPCKISLTIAMEAFISRVRSQLPNGAQMDVFWLKGEDTLFHTKLYENLIQLGFHTIYVLNRECSEKIINKTDEFKPIQDYHEKRWREIQAISSFPEKLHLVQATRLNISSRTIRACARNTFATRDQLHACIQLDKITTYIIQHQLWSTKPTIMSAPSVFPNGITDLTPEILSSMLSTYSISSVKVNSFRFEQIGVGTGWNGSLYRLNDIQYSPDSTSCLPSSVILKLSTGIWLQRVASIEPDFYSKLAPRISNIEIPKCYYVARHPHSPNESMLLLEDLSIDYDPLGPKESLKDSTIFLLIATIASLHAEFFNHPLLQQDTFAWLPSLNSTLVHYHSEYALKMTDREYTQLLESRVSPKAYAYAKALVTHIPHIFQTLTDEHYTLSHGDFWINNIFVRHNQSHRIRF